MNSTSDRAGPVIAWDSGTAYDLFSSLVVLHRPRDFGIRRSWAAGVRNRLATESRAVLAAIVERFTVPVAWIRTLEPPRTAERARAAIEAIPDDEVLATLCPRDRRERDRCAEDADGLGGDLKRAVAEYVDRFFIEEVARIEPVVNDGLVRARKLAAELDAVTLVEELTGGLAIEELDRAPRLTLIPVFWVGPLVLWEAAPDGATTILFSARPRNVALVPGAPVPEMLLLGLEAISDPTRLRVIRLLASRSLTQAELARELRLRPPTITHHLRLLRLANIVRLRESVSGEKRYEVRERRLASLVDDLEEFTGIPRHS